MADKTERAVQSIARKRNGAAKTIDDVFDVVLALADDTDETAIKLAVKVEEQHQESLEAIEGSRAVLKAHCVEAARRDARIEAVEITLKECPASWSKDHSAMHDVHMAEFHPVHREDDPEDSDFRKKRLVDGEDKRVWAMWSIGIGLLERVALPVLAVLATLLLTGGLK